ncbi:MAG: AarF/ABC1/UbiB kinase family protein [Myxococcales bacterium]|nr:AarF/ABC1/UbiB kinase family protein [Myxococcales bacterium]MCB9526422.1 AarF/ABC1/UbiB kinase family protein [Myxococcales bacterium]
MGKWDELAGEKGRRVDTSRLGRAVKLGKLGARFTGSMIKAQLGRKKSDDEGEQLEAMADAALRNAKHIVQVMGEMKGAAMKVGQMLSADPDLVAPEFADMLATLQHDAPPMDYVTVAQVVEAALDRPIDAVFKFFDPEPIGSASIGQVHRATLPDGRAVAVKVQYPGIEASLESDLKNLASLLKVGRVLMTRERAESIVAEARNAILSEADYEAEARNLQRFHDLLADFPGVRVPAPVMALSRRSLLVMEFIEGQKLDDAMAALPASRRDAVAERFIALFVHLYHDHAVLHADPHPGNFMLDGDDNVVLLDFGCVRQYAPRWPDSVLKLLTVYWRRDGEGIRRVFTEQGYGKPGMTMPDGQVLLDYLDLILAPLREDAEFDFGDWQVHAKTRQYVRQHLEMVKLVPPPEMLLYYRVLLGVKGIMARSGARLNLRHMAEAACVRRGIPL